jgi:hypothetical protein
MCDAVEQSLESNGGVWDSSRHVVALRDVVAGES